jgi:hypothetical protein
MPEDRRRRILRTVQSQIGENAVRWEESFEEERVKFLLTRCGVAGRKGELLAAGRQRYGRPRLTFDLFNDTFPTFPLLMRASRLGGVKLHEDARASLPELFTRFEKAPFFQIWEDFYAEVVGRANNRAVALVFPRNRVRGALVMHDGGLDDYFVHGTVLAYTGGTKDKPYRLYVQPFGPLVEAIHNRGHGWRAGD